MLDTRPEATAGWEVEEDDYGDLMIGHVHPWGAVPAYVIERTDGGSVAQCSDCMAQVRLAGTSAAAFND
jgi:hypothetical protein